MDEYTVKELMRADEERIVESHLRKGKLLGFTRMDLAVPLFVFAGLGAGFVSSMAVIAFGYDSTGHLAKYIPTLLVFPTFLLALTRRRWASVPVWVCWFWVIALVLMQPTQHMRSANEIKTALELLCIPLLIQAARFIRGKSHNSN